MILSTTLLVFPAFKGVLWGLDNLKMPQSCTMLHNCGS